MCLSALVLACSYITNQYQLTALQRVAYRAVAPSLGETQRGEARQCADVHNPEARVPQLAAYFSNTRPLRSAPFTLGGCVLGRPAWPSRRFTARYSNGLLRAAAPNNPGPHSREHVRICCSRPPPGFHFDYKPFFRGGIEPGVAADFFFRYRKKTPETFFVSKGSNACLNNTQLTKCAS